MTKVSTDKLSLVPPPKELFVLDDFCVGPLSEPEIRPLMMFLLRSDGFLKFATGNLVKSLLLPAADVGPLIERGRKEEGG